MTQSRIAILGGAAVIAAMLLIPPWEEHLALMNASRTSSLGYALVFDPPANRKESLGDAWERRQRGDPEPRVIRGTVRIDWSRLSVQVAAIAVISAAVAFALRMDKPLLDAKMSQSAS